MFCLRQAENNIIEMDISIEREHYTMARLKIDFPDNFIFSTEIPVRIGDMNRGMHLGHEIFLVIIEEARARLLAKFGYTDTDIKGLGLILTDASIVYLSQVRYGQTLKVDIAVIDFSSRGFDMVYRISDTKTGVESARAKTGVLLYDYKQQKVTTIPEDFKRQLLD